MAVSSEPSFLQGSTNLDNIQIIKKAGGRLNDSFLDEGGYMINVRASFFAGFILNKKIGVNCPKRIENAKILIANTRRFEVPILKSHLRPPSHGHGQD